LLNDFAYVGIDHTGKEGHGVIAAMDRKDALTRLKERGLNRHRPQKKKRAAK